MMPAFGQQYGYPDARPQMDTKLAPMSNPPYGFAMAVPMPPMMQREGPVFPAAAMAGHARMPLADGGAAQMHHNPTVPSYGFPYKQPLPHSALYAHAPPFQPSGQPFARPFTQAPPAVGRAGPSVRPARQGALVQPGRGRAVRTEEHKDPMPLARDATERLGHSRAGSASSSRASSRSTSPTRAGSQQGQISIDPSVDPLSLSRQLKGQVSSVLKTHKGSLMVQKCLEAMTQKSDKGGQGTALDEGERALFDVCWSEVCEELPLLMMNRFAQYAIGANSCFLFLVSQ